MNLHNKVDCLSVKWEIVEKADWNVVRKEEKMSLKYRYTKISGI